MPCDVPQPLTIDVTYDDPMPTHGILRWPPGLVTMYAFHQEDKST
jgi:hypothetical protein